jgi:hypothetical protein
MNRIVGWSCVSLLTLLLTPSTANATSIGRFSFDVHDAFGPFFTVEHYSGSPASGIPDTPFTDVVIHLFLSGTELQPNLVLDPFDSSNGDVLAGGPGRDTLLTDLWATTFDSATVSFGFAVPGSVIVEPLDVIALLACHANGDCTGVDPASNSIEFTPAAPEGTPVPEPATLLFVGTGLVAAARRRRPSPVIHDSNR